MQAELTSRLRDKSFWLEALLLPLIITGIMGFAMGEVGRGKIPTVRVGIVASTNEVLPAQILETAFKATGSLEVALLTDAAEARERLASAGLDALVFVPDFDPGEITADTELRATVESGKSTQFQASLVAQITEATLRAVSAELGARMVVAELMADKGLDPTPAWKVPTPVPVSARLEELPLQRFDLLGSQFAGLAIFFSVLSAFRMMGNIFGDHRHGLSLRLAGLPARPGYVALGHITTVATVAAVQTFTVLALGAMAFGVKWGPLLPLVLATLSAALSSAALALALVVLPGSSTVRGLVGTLVVLGGSVLGGSLVPLDGAGPTLKLFARGTLHYWVTGLFTGLARGLTLFEVAGMFVGVVAYGGFAMALGAIFLGRRRAARA